MGAPCGIKFRRQSRDLLRQRVEDNAFHLAFVKGGSASPKTIAIIPRVDRPAAAGRWQLTRQRRKMEDERIPRPGSLI